MDAQAEKAIAFQLQQVKELYAELFMLLVQSIAEDPMEQAIGAVDRSIEQLMASIDAHMKDLRVAIGAAGPLEPALDTNIRQFETQLRQGLAKMADAVKRRSEELSAARERLKERLRMVQLKGRGAQGYRRRQAPTARLIESQI